MLHFYQISSSALGNVADAVRFELASVLCTAQMQTDGEMIWTCAVTGRISDACKLSVFRFDFHAANCAHSRQHQHLATILGISYKAVYFRIQSVQLIRRVGSFSGAFRLRLLYCSCFCAIVLCSHPLNTIWLGSKIAPQKYDSTQSVPVSHIAGSDLFWVRVRGCE